MLKKLRNLSDGRRADSTFVYKCVQKILENDIKIISNRKTTGSGDILILTPEKKKIIEDLFMERLTVENLDGIVFTDCFNRLNIHEYIDSKY